MQSTISLIIPTNTVDSHLEQCLERVGRCRPQPLEVIVVLDGDRGQSIPEVGGRAITVVRLPECSGPGKARNKGAEQAVGDILLFIDKDVLIPEDTFARLETLFSSTDRPDAVFGSYDDNPVEQDSVSQYKNLHHHYTHQHASREAFTFWTGCGAVLRKRFLELKGFNEEYQVPSVEDIEFGYRLKKTGGTILLDKSLQVTHLKKWSLVDMLRTDFFHRAIPWSTIVLRHGRMENDMNIDLASRVSVSATVLILFCLLLSAITPLFILCAVLFLLLFLWLNRGLFSFFFKKRGLLFLIKVIPLQFVYFFLSGVAFFSVFLLHCLGKTKQKG